MAIASIGGSTVPLNPNPTPGPAPGTQSPTTANDPAPVAGPTPAPPPGTNGTAPSDFMELVGGGLGALAGGLLGGSPVGIWAGSVLGGYVGGHLLGDGTPSTGVQYNLWDGSQYVPIVVTGATDPNQFNVTGALDSGGVFTVTVVAN